jgi:hypothetical protein
VTDRQGCLAALVAGLLLWVAALIVLLIAEQWR